MNYGATLLVVIAITVIVPAIVLFSVSSIDSPHNVESNIHMERFDLTLVSDTEDARIVEGDFPFSIDQEVPVTVGGDVVNATIPSGAFYSAGDATVVPGIAMFVLKESAAPGDEVEILIRHGASETTVTAMLEAAT